MSLRQVTAIGSVKEPIDLDDLRRHLVVEHNDFDSYLRTILSASRTHAEHYIEGVIADRDYEYVLDDLQGEIKLPIRPVDNSSIVVKYFDVQGVEQTLNALSICSSSVSTTIKPVYGSNWPDVEPGYNKVTISFTAGYAAAMGEVHNDIKQAILMIAATLFDQREDHSANVKLHKVPMTSKLLLDSYKLVTV